MTAALKVIPAASGEPAMEVAAFIDDAESRAVLRMSLEKLGVKRFAIEAGGLRRWRRFLSRSHPPRLLFFDVGGHEMPLSLVNELAECCPPDVNVIVVGERSDIGLFRELLHLGVTDYIVKPLTAELLIRALETGLARPGATVRQARGGKVIGVTGSRGGVGTTTLAAQLAKHLTTAPGRRVVALDLDLEGGNLAHLLDANGTSGLARMLAAPRDIDEGLVERCTAERVHGIHVLALAAPPEREADCAPDGPGQLLRHLRRQFHYVVVDLPRGRWKRLAGAAEECDVVLLVSERTLAGAQGAARCRSLLLGVEERTDGVRCLINRVRPGRLGLVSRGEFADIVGSPVRHEVPYCRRALRRAQELGAPLEARGHPFVRAVRRVADDFSGTRGRRGLGLRRLLGW